MNKSTRILLAALMALASASLLANTASIDAELQALTSEFDAARYDLPSGDARMKAMEAVRLHGAELESKFPKRAEPLLWQAWALDAQATIDQSYSALSRLKQARKKLEAAIAIDPTVNGADAYTLLGGLYAQIPGFPISYGDTKKGREYLLKALAINPTGAQANLGYARYHRKMGDQVGVIKYASAVLSAPSRPGREKADADLRAQAEAMIAQSKAQLK